MEPQSRLGIATLTSQAYAGENLQDVQDALLRKVSTDESPAGALMDLSVVEQLRGDAVSGQIWQDLALAQTRQFRVQRAGPARKTVLVFAAPIHMGGNTPVDFLLQGSGFDLIYIYPDQPATETETAAMALPRHDVCFNAAPMDDPNAPDFASNVRALTQDTEAHVLNLPSVPIDLDRDKLGARLESVSGVTYPASLRIPRERLAAFEPSQCSALEGYPYLIRPVGSHAGQGLERITCAADLSDYLDRHAEQVFIVTAYVDYATPHDGAFRKYRIVFINGRAYPVHMAIAERWDVWYMNAGMQENAHKRAQEQAFMDGFETGFGARHADALKAVTARLGLDYVGIDCAEDAQGNLVVFEADNALIVHDMDCPQTYPYKSAHMQRIFAAFELMLLRACRRDLDALPDQPRMSPITAQPVRHVHANRG